MSTQCLHVIRLFTWAYDYGTLGNTPTLTFTADFFKLIIGAPITFLLENVHANFGFSAIV